MVSQAAELKMPQAGAAPREPSMEEILASIRRIIEDSDQGRKPEPAEAVREAAPEAVRDNAEPETTDERAPEMRGPAPTPVREEQKPAAAAVPEPVAPAAARREEPAVHRARETEAAAAQPARPAPRAPEAPAAARPEPAPRQPDPARPQPARAETKPSDGPAARVAAEPVDVTLGEMDLDIEAGLAPVASAAHSEAEAEAAGPAALSRPADRTALISERTGRQVAAAFGELSEAFEASRRKSFDEIASEMIRPMLQDWLDNNLPTLVEKLVREEIERVARGGR